MPIVWLTLTLTEFTNTSMPALMGGSRCSDNRYSDNRYSDNRTVGLGLISVLATMVGSN